MRLLEFIFDKSINTYMAVAKYSTLLLIVCVSVGHTITFIDASDLVGGITISDPGSYRLSENVLWTAANDDNAAITIDSVGPVVLNLAGHTLRQNSATSFVRNAAIVVKEGSSHVTIEAGIVADFTGVGVYVKHNVRHVYIKNLDLSSTGKASSYLATDFSRPFSGGILVQGLDGAYTYDVVIDNCYIHDFDQTFPLVAGVGVGGENGVTVLRTTGFKLLNSVVATLKSNDAAACIFLGLTEDVEIKKFFCEDVFGERNSNGLDSMTQTYNSDGSVNLNRKNVRVLIQDANFENIRVDDPRGNEALGVELNGEDFVYRRVNISNVKNTAVNTGNRAIAFQVSNNHLGLIENCSASDIIHSGNRPESRAGGFSVDNADAITIRHSKAENIHHLATSPSGTIQAYGFRGQSLPALPLRPLQEQTIFEKCTSINISSEFIGIGSYAAGFVLDSVREGAISFSHSKKNRQGIVIVGDATNTEVRKNLIVQNQLGVLDTSTSSSSPNIYDKNLLLENDQHVELGDNTVFLDNNVLTPKE